MGSKYPRIEVFIGHYDYAGIGQRKQFLPPFRLGKEFESCRHRAQSSPESPKQQPRAHTQPVASGLGFIGFRGLGV